MSSATETFGKDIAFKEDLIPSATGDLDTFEGLQNIREALYRRIATYPGTLIHRPTYGVGLQKYMGALNSIDNRRKLSQEIFEQLQLEPRVEAVTGVSFTAVDNSSKVQVRVQVSLAGYDEITLSFEA